MSGIMFLFAIMLVLAIGVLLFALYDSRHRHHQVK